MVILDTALASTVEGTINWAGLPWWAWLLIFLLVVLFLWWRLAVSSKEMELEAQALVAHDDHGHDAQAEPEPEELGPVDQASVEAVVADADLEPEEDEGRNAG